ncbi:MAG: TIGR04282 family arsenosugar biosynthesis glycosyltransferase [Bdellovibrionales bacterium]|nr:TIGR04282 family arsenosugar biosynthesis glycosyltransferase [Bdellovibrionales bacterium]
MSESLVIFLRYPAAGEVKTRLVPALGEVGAARFYRKMAESVCSKVNSNARIDRRGIAYFTPHSAESQIQAWLGSELQLRAQPEGDLGKRLDHIFGERFDSGDSSVVAIGTDCVDLDGNLVDAAFNQLKSNDAVLGPAQDGGYYLIGLSKPMPGLFENIPWSSHDTFDATVQKLRKFEAKLSCLKTLRDIDVPEDLKHLSVDWKQSAKGCMDAREVWD